jgi:hypothetical protein
LASSTWLKRWETWLETKRSQKPRWASSGEGVGVLGLVSMETFVKSSVSSGPPWPCPSPLTFDSSPDEQVDHTGDQPGADQGQRCSLADQAHAVEFNALHQGRVLLGQCFDEFGGGLHLVFEGID